MANNDYNIQELSSLFNGKIEQEFYGLSFRESITQNQSKNPWEHFPKINYDKSSPDEIGNHIFLAAHYANKYNKGIIDINEIFEYKYTSFLNTSSYGPEANRFMLEIDGKMALSYVALGIKNPKGKIMPYVNVDGGKDFSYTPFFKGEYYNVYGRTKRLGQGYYRWWTEHWFYDSAYDYWYAN